MRMLTKLDRIISLLVRLIELLEYGLRYQGCEIEWLGDIEEERR